MSWIHLYHELETAKRKESLIWDVYILEEIERLRKEVEKLKKQSNQSKKNNR